MGTIRYDNYDWATTDSQGRFQGLLDHKGEPFNIAKVVYTPEGNIVGLQNMDGTTSVLDSSAVTPETLGLEHVDNTHDVDKPISNDTQLAINAVAAEVGNLQPLLISITIPDSTHTLNATLRSNTMVYTNPAGCTVTIPSGLGNFNAKLVQGPAAGSVHAVPGVGVTLAGASTTAAPNTAIDIVRVGVDAYSGVQTSNTSGGGSTTVIDGLESTDPTAALAASQGPVLTGLVGTAQAVADAAQPLITPDTVSATAYTLLATDHQHTKICSNDAGCSVTLPAGLTNFAAVLMQLGAGTVTAVPASGVTLTVADGGPATTAGPGMGVAVMQTGGPNVYTLFRQVAPVSSASSVPLTISGTTALTGVLTAVPGPGWTFPVEWYKGATATGITTLTYTKSDADASAVMSCRALVGSGVYFQTDPITLGGVTTVILMDDHFIFELGGAAAGSQELDNRTPDTVNVEGGIWVQDGGGHLISTDSSRMHIGNTAAAHYPVDSRKDFTFKLWVLDLLGTQAMIKLRRTAPDSSYEVYFNASEVDIYQRVGGSVVGGSLGAGTFSAPVPFTIACAMSAADVLQVYVNDAPVAGATCTLSGGTWDVGWYGGANGWDITRAEITTP